MWAQGLLRKITSLLTVECQPFWTFWDQKCLMVLTSYKWGDFRDPAVAVVCTTLPLHPRPIPAPSPLLREYTHMHTHTYAC